MQIVNAAGSQTLNSNSSELRTRENQQLLSSSTRLFSTGTESELQSSQASFNRDRVTLSSQAVALSRLATPENAQLEQGVNIGLSTSAALQNQQAPSATQGTPQAATAGTGATATASGSSEQEQAVEQQELAQIRDLAARDREVRAHEQAHAAIGGQFASAPSYTFERGPDGRLYAVAGEVQIDTSPVPNDPQATLEKAETVQRAALGVAEPSPADRAVAAEAQALAADARAEILRQELAEQAEEQEAEAAEEESNEAPEISPGERLQEFRDQQQSRTDNASEALNEFNDRLREISVQLAQINQRISETGATGVGSTQNAFPAGSFLDLIV